MGVKDPHDLPAKRSKPGDDGDKILVSCVGILVRGYKRGREEMGQGDYSPMAQSLSHEDLITCATYTQRMRDHNLGLCPPPSGPPPPGYDKYIHLVSRGPPPIPTNDCLTYQFNPLSANMISMPPEAFNHFVSSQVHSLEITVEFGCLRVVNQMSYLTVGLLENTSRLVDVSLNWTINSTG